MNPLARKIIKKLAWDISEEMSKRLLKGMGWDRITYGYAITNVGRMDIPTVYGPLLFDAVYGPSFYSDVEEKIVGVMRVPLQTPVAQS